MSKLTAEEELRKIFGQLKNSDLQYLPDFQKSMGGAASGTRSSDARRTAFNLKVVAALAASVVLVVSLLVVYTNKKPISIATDVESEMNEMERLSQACDDFLLVISGWEPDSFSQWHPTSDQFLVEVPRHFSRNEIP